MNDELSNDFLNDELNILTDEIIDDRCDDEVVAHMLSQLKEEHVVDALSCYDVLILDNEYFRFVCHWA